MQRVIHNLWPVIYLLGTDFNRFFFSRSHDAFFFFYFIFFFSQNQNRASESPSGKEQFLSQFEQIVGSLMQTRSRLESRIASEQVKRDSVSRSYQDLIERQRLYQRVIEKFKKECTRHEILSSNLTASHSE